MWEHLVWKLIKLQKLFSLCYCLIVVLYATKGEQEVSVKPLQTVQQILLKGRIFFLLLSFE